MGEDSGEKTEQPTPHKLREARKKGQVAKSKDLTAALLLLGAFYTLKASAGYIWEQMTYITMVAFQQIPLEFSATVAGHLLFVSLKVFGAAVAPIFAVNMIIAIVVEVMQTGFLISFESIKPDINKLNPIEGVKKFFSLKQYVELIKSVIKMTVIIAIIFFVLKDEFYMVILSQQMTLLQSMVFTGSLVMKIVTRIGLFYVVIAIFDYFYQKHEHIKGLKMSKKEIKDEYKKLEGDPLIKQRQKDTARQMAQGRQMGSIPDSDVIVTNPVHVAIAIKYKPNNMRAPIVLAKGKRLIALQIRSLAEESRIPIVENPLLARNLYDSVDVGGEVPPTHYKAIAEILAFVYNLKKAKSTRF